MLDDPGLIGMALLVFTLRLVNMGIITVRTLLVTRQFESVSAVLGFFESLAFIVAVGLVASDLDNVANVAANSLGFAAGTVIGMRVEEWLGYGYVTVHAFSRPSGMEVARALHAEGFGATRMRGEGWSSPVDVVLSVVPRTDAQRVVDIVHRVDHDAFVRWDDVRTISRGWVRMPGRRP